MPDTTREKGSSTIYDRKGGRKLFQSKLVTLCPIVYAAECRKMAWEFAQTIEILEGLSEPKTMPDLVGPIGGTVVTHILCDRPVNTEELELQSAWMKNSGKLWASDKIYTPQDVRSKKAFMLANMVMINEQEGDNVLAQLGLEVIE